MKVRFGVGAAAVIAVSSVAFSVFGPPAAQRALAVGGYAEPVAAGATVGEVAPPKEASLSQIVAPELEDPYSGRAARMSRPRQRPV